MSNIPFHVVIIGAGASGLACAVRIAQVLDAQGLRDAARIEVYEASRKIGHSILASGNGRCNYSNTKIYEDTSQAGRAGRFYTNAAFVDDVHAACNAHGVSAPAWLASLGLLGREAKKHDGMLFPVSNQAQTVLDTLIHWCEAYGIAVLSQTRVDEIVRTPDGRFSLAGVRSVAQVASAQSKITPKKKAKKPQYQEVSFSRSADAVVLAIGRALYDAPQLALGHPMTPLHPVLGPLRATLRDVPDVSQGGRALDGVRQQVGLCVLPQNTHRPIFSETGEVLFRPYGISGIVVFNASRFTEPGDSVELDLLPDVSRDAFMQHLIQTYEAWIQVEQTTMGDMIDALLRGVFVAPVREVIVGRVCAALREERTRSLATWSVQDKAHVLCECVVDASKHVAFEIEGIATDQTCQVMRGGCEVHDVDPATCESRLIPRFYITGEALDVDGPCGGFNLDWAWTSGMVAGEALAQEVVR